MREAPRSPVEPKQIVAAGYDALGRRFGEWGEQIDGDPWQNYVDDLASRLPSDGRVLDLGCGNGVKIARLAERFEVVAVDLSEEQLRLARKDASQATLVHGDFSELDFPAQSFDAVTALYSFVHVPRDKHRGLFERIAVWLKPGGLFLAALSHLGGEDRTEAWLGVEMFFSGFDAETNRRLVREVGFELILDRLEYMQEPQGEVAFLWVLASNPA